MTFSNGKCSLTAKAEFLKLRNSVNQLNNNLKQFLNPPSGVTVHGTVCCVEQHYDKKMSIATTLAYESIGFPLSFDTLHSNFFLKIFCLEILCHTDGLSYFMQDRWSYCMQDSFIALLTRDVLYGCPLNTYITLSPLLFDQSCMQ